MPKPIERGTRLPARVQFVGDKKANSIAKGTAVRFTEQNGLTHYEVHLDRGGNALIEEKEVFLEE